MTEAILATSTGFVQEANRSCRRKTASASSIVSTVLALGIMAYASPSVGLPLHVAKNVLGIAQALTAHVEKVAPVAEHRQAAVARLAQRFKARGPKLG